MGSGNVCFLRSGTRVRNMPRSLLYPPVFLGGRSGGVHAVVLMEAGQPHTLLKIDGFYGVLIQVEDHSCLPFSLLLLIRPYMLTRHTIRLSMDCVNYHSIQLII